MALLLIHVCTIATFAPYEPIFGNGDIEYSSRKHTPDGKFNNASGRHKVYEYSIPVLEIYNYQTND